MKQNEKLLLTSFIFTIFVVWLHAGEPLLSYVPGQVAVPGFFMLSGYLFMKGIPSDDAAAEKEAVRLQIQSGYDKASEAVKDAVKKACARTFQAIRIDVNQEFEVLYQFLDKLPDVLAPGRRAAILPFHSVCF